VIENQAESQTIIAADPLTDDLHEVLWSVHGTTELHTKLAMPLLVAALPRLLTSAS
jgi:hypothetical protein